MRYQSPRCSDRCTQIVGATIEQEKDCRGRLSEYLSTMYDERKVTDEFLSTSFCLLNSSSN